MKSAPGTKGWDVDLKHGQEGENALLAVVNGKVEVKRDRVAWASRRVAVEYAYKGKPSGIAVTEAKWWAFVIDDLDGSIESILMVPIARLKAAARENYRQGNTLLCGDNDSSAVVMVPLSELI